MTHDDGWKRRSLCALAVVLTISIALAIFGWLTPKNDAPVTALLRIWRAKPYIAFPPNETRAEQDAFRETTRQLFYTRNVLNRALEAYSKKASATENLDNYVEDWRSQIRTRFIKNSDLLEVSIDGDYSTAEDRKRILNAVVHSFIEYYGHYGQGLTRTQLRVLAEEKHRREASLSNLRERVFELEKKTRVNEEDPPSIAALKQLLKKAEVEVELAKLNLFLSEDGESNDVQKESVDSIRAEIDAKVKVRDYLRKRIAKESIVRAEVSGSDVELRFAQSELERQEQVYDRISQRIVELQTEGYPPSRVELIDQASFPPPKKSRFALWVNKGILH